MARGAGDSTLVAALLNNLGNQRAIASDPDGATAAYAESAGIANSANRSFARPPGRGNPA